MYAQKQRPPDVEDTEGLGYDAVTGKQDMVLWDGGPEQEVCG